MKKPLPKLAVGLATMMMAQSALASSPEVPLEVQHIRKELKSIGELNAGSEYVLKFLSTAAKQCPHENVSLTREINKNQNSELDYYTVVLSCNLEMFQELPTHFIDYTAVFGQYGKGGSIYIIDLESRMGHIAIDPIDL